MTLIVEAVQKLDRSIFLFFQQLQHPQLDFLLAWPTCFGDTSVALTLIGATALAVDRIRGILKIPAAAFSLVLTERAVDYLKKLFGRPRPFLALENVSVIFSKPTNHAFPSGHAAVAFAAAYVIARYYPKGSAWAYGIAVWVCVTRLYVGVHYPSDLLAGAILGTVISALSCFILQPITKRASAS